VAALVAAPLLTALVGCGPAGASPPGVRRPTLSQSLVAEPTPGPGTLVLKTVPSNPTTVPVRPVPGVTVVHVPVYPGAAFTAKTLPLGAGGGTPATPYLRKASETLAAPASENQVTAWYRTAMTQSGLQVVSQGYAGDKRTGVTEEFVSYGSTADSAAGDKTPTITVTTYAESPDETLVSLYATDVVVPARPQSTYIPAGITRITGSVTLYGSAVTTHTVNVTDPRLIHDLVRALNRLTVVEAGAHSCPAVSTTADLTLYPAHGQGIHVQIATDCGINIDGIGFWPTGSPMAQLLHHLVKK
jgi:hypothetical protein